MPVCPTTLMNGPFGNAWNFWSIMCVASNRKLMVSLLAKAHQVAAGEVDALELIAAAVGGESGEA